MPRNGIVADTNHRERAKTQRTLISASFNNQPRPAEHTIDPLSALTDSIAACEMIPAAERAFQKMINAVELEFETIHNDAWTGRFMSLAAGLDPFAQGLPATISILTDAVAAPIGYADILLSLTERTLGQAGPSANDIDTAHIHIVNAVLFSDILCCARTGNLACCASWVLLSRDNSPETIENSLRDYFMGAPLSAEPRQHRDGSPTPTTVAIPETAALAALRLLEEGRWMTEQQRKAAIAVKNVLRDAVNKNS